MIHSVLNYLERAIENNPDKTIFATVSEHISYRKFQSEAFAMGTSLVKCGLKQRSPIAVFIDKNIEALITFFGILYAGGIYSPFDTNAPIERINMMLEVLKPAYIITEKKYYDKACKLNFPKEKILLEKNLRIKCEDYSEDVKKRAKQIVDTDPVYIICTSGSTGTPKGVVIPHRAVIDFTEEASDTMHLSGKEIFANEAPFYFDASVPDIYCTIRNVATMNIIPREWFRFPVKVLEYMRERKVNSVFWVPSALIAVANLRALGEVELPELRKVMFCGEVMPVKQLNMWRKYYPNVTYVNYYGPTETTYASVYYVVDREFQNDEVLPIGKAAVNTRVYILGDDGKEVNRGDVGELCIGGSGLALGYYNNPGKTSESFVNHPCNDSYPERIYKTGDLVRMNPRGEIEYVGRKDFQIKLNGYRIELGDIETAAMSIEGVDRVCCVFNNKKNKIILVYEGRVKKIDLKEKLVSLIPRYMFPEILKEEGGLPISSNNKIDRTMIKEKYGY